MKKFKFMLFLILYQIISFIVVRVTGPIVALFPPYSLLDIRTLYICLHIFFSLLAFILSLYHYE